MKTSIPSEKSLEEMLNDCSIDAIMAIDTDKNIIAWNTTAEKIHGKAKHEVIGRPLFEVIPSMKEDNETLQAVSTALKGIKSFVQASKKYYHRHHAENHFIPLKDEGNIIGVMHLAHDVAHRIKAEEQLQQLNGELSLKNKELQQRNTELISLSNVASNDMKEPLRRIYTAVEAIIVSEARQLSNSSKAHLRRIQSASQKMGLITDDLLSFVNVTEKKQVATINLNEVVADARSKLQKIITEKSPVIFVEKLPSITGNYELLVQLFKNIMHNALKFQPDHIPQIAITSEKKFYNNKYYLLICFKDNGIGFPQQQAEEIFNLFTKLHSANEFSGNGIGLAISKRIMDLHNGFINADSTENEGTKVYCSFPADI